MVGGGWGGVVRVGSAGRLFRKLPGDHWAREEAAAADLPRLRALDKTRWIRVALVS